MNQRIVGNAKEAVVCTLGQNYLADDPRTAPKVPRFLAFDATGHYVGEFTTLEGAFNIGWGRTIEEAQRLAKQHTEAA